MKAAQLHLPVLDVNNISHCLCAANLMSRLSTRNARRLEEIPGVRTVLVRYLVGVCMGRLPHFSSRQTEAGFGTHPGYLCECAKNTTVGTLVAEEKVLG